jgi:glycerate dehydrogenase
VNCGIAKPKNIERKEESKKLNFREVMNIVVVDGYTLNPGDLNWDDLNALGNCAVYERTSPNELPARIENADIVLTNKVVISKDTIAHLPNLKYIGVLATGYNIVDVAAAHEANIIVTNIHAYSTMSVAQTVFVLLLELTHHAGHHSDSVHEGLWQSRKDFSFWDFPLTEIAGKKLGIVGFGNIGRATAAIGKAFGMDVSVTTKHPEKHPPSDFVFTDLQTLFKTSDVLSLHCPLTEETQRLVNDERISVMRKSSFLINTSRGGLVDEQALANALNTNLIAGAGLDVLSTEPPNSDNPLLTAKNCIITPHFAWASVEARIRLMRTAVENIKSFLAGKPVNLITH